MSARRGAGSVKAWAVPFKRSVSPGFGIVNLYGANALIGADKDDVQRRLDKWNRDRGAVHPEDYSVVPVTITFNVRAQRRGKGKR